MLIEQFKEMLAETDPDLILYPDYDKAFIGIARRACKENVAVYDYDKCIQVLMEGGIESREEAEEYFEFNTACAYVGDRTPVIFHTWCGRKPLPSW